MKAIFYLFGIPVFFWNVGDHHSHKKGNNLIKALRIRNRLKKTFVLKVKITGYNDPLESL